MANRAILAALIVVVELLVGSDCQSYERSRDIEAVSPKRHPNNFDTKVDGSKNSLHVFKESSEALLSHPDILKGGRTSQTNTHDVIFVVHGKNMDELTRILHDVSDPLSVNYGNHLTRQEIDDLTSNPDSRKEVIAYLRAAGVTVLPDELSGECILARAEIKLWERILNTEFHTYSFQSTDDVIIRADEYSIPVGLDQHVESVLNTVQFPHAMADRPQPRRIGNIDSIRTSRFSEASEYWEGYTTPQLLNDAYFIDDNSGHPRATQAAFEGWYNYFSPEDLTKFQNTFGLPVVPANKTIGNHTATAAWCKRKGYEPCAEGNLDMMYIMAMATTPTYFYWSPFPTFGQWLQFLVNDKTPPPLVISISYGSEEKNIGKAELKIFLDNAIKLGVMGTTILSASGDDGASATAARTDSRKCGYSPLWPTTCPYVVSVGATQVNFDFNVTCEGYFYYYRLAILRFVPFSDTRR